MKKLFILLALAIGLAPNYVSAQSEWTKTFIGDNDGVTAVAITETGRIVVFGYENHYYESNNGVDWQAKVAPFELGIPQQAIGEGFCVAVATTNSLFSYDGYNWSRIIWGPFYTITRNAQGIFAAGRDAYVNYGGYWYELPQLEALLPDENSFFAASGGSGNIFTVFISSTDSNNSGAIPVTSVNDGDWVVQPTLPISVAADAVLSSNSYSVVGTVNADNPALMRSVGAINYTLDPGSLFAAMNFDGVYWTGGYYGNEWPDDPDAQGILIPDGDLSQAYITDAPIVSMAANASKLVAIDSRGGVYSIDSGTAGVPTVASQKFTVYPNPTTSVVRFTLKASTLVSTFSASGVILDKKRMPAGENILDLSARPIGMYFVRIGSDTAVKVMKQ